MPFGRRERPSHHFSLERIVRALDPAGLVVEEAQVVVHKADQPDLLLDLADADPLAGKDMTEADFALADTDAPARGDQHRAIVEGVLRLC